MEKLKGKKKFLIFIVGSFIYILILTFLFERRGVIDVLNLKRELAYLQKEVEILEKKKERLRWEIRILKENPRAIEGIVREDLGFVYPDEIIVIIDEKYLEFQK